jgi:hypothetical protein
MAVSSVAPPVSNVGTINAIDEQLAAGEGFHVGSATHSRLNRLNVV